MFALSRIRLCYQCAVRLTYNTSRYVYTSDVPRITVPQKMIKRLEKLKLKRSALEHQQERTYKGPVLISCRRSKFNHHKGQTYSNFTPRMLASAEWKGAKSKNDHFTFNPHKGIPAYEGSTADTGTFEEMNLSPQLQQVLVDNEFIRPTLIQAKAIPSLLRGKNALCAAETGGGKTLTYLIPILEKILATPPSADLIDEETLDDTGTSHTNNRSYPLAVVLLPTKELVLQVTEVTEALCRSLPVTVRSMLGHHVDKKHANRTDLKPPDIIITTPGVILTAIKKGKVRFSRLQTFVMDEMDTLLDDSFSDVMKDVLWKINVQSGAVDGSSSDGDFEEQTAVDVVGTQLLMIGATIPLGMERILEDIVPTDTLEMIRTPYVHCLLPHIPQKFIRTGRDDKIEYLLKQIKGKSTATMVFCKNTATVIYVSRFLHSSGVECVAMHGEMKIQDREEQLSQFRDRQCNVMVCTDILSRGVDTKWVTRVINYDFPSFMSDYIHRVGRVGRVGSESKGHVISFIAHKWEVDLLWKIETAVRHVLPLHNVNANIKRKLVSRSNLKKGIYIEDLDDEINDFGEVVQ